MTTVVSRPKNECPIVASSARAADRLRDGRGENEELASEQGSAEQVPTELDEILGELPFAPLGDPDDEVERRGGFGSGERPRRGWVRIGMIAVSIAVLSALAYVAMAGTALRPESMFG